MLKRQIRLASTSQPLTLTFFNRSFRQRICIPCTATARHTVHMRFTDVGAAAAKSKSASSVTRILSHLHSWHYLIRQRALQLCRAVMLSLLCLNHTTRRMFLLKLWILSFINTQIPIFIVCIRSITSDAEICRVYKAGPFF